MKSYDRCEICRLANHTLSQIISLNSPKDICCCEAVCSAFRAVANTDAIWERFIPSDIISRFVDPPPVFPSKKELFFHLCDHDTLTDNGTMTFRLDRKTGAKVYLVKNITITWGNDSQYWQKVPFRDSRFGEVSTLLIVWWLEMYLVFNVKDLSPNTMYASYLVFKLEEDSDGLDVPQKTFVTFSNNETRHDVCLQPEEDMLLERNEDIRFPKERQDGWTEMKLGEFYVKKGEVSEVRTGLREAEKLNSKRGLIVEGIEIRPKEIDD